MRNLIFVFALLLTVFSSCNKDDDFAPVVDGVGIEDTLDPQIEDEEDEDEEQGENDEQNEDEDEDNNEEELCLFSSSKLEGDFSFTQAKTFKRNAKGQVVEVSLAQNGGIIRKAKISYTEEGILRGIIIDSAGRQDAVSFDAKGRPVDIASQFTTGEKSQTKFVLDNKDRITKKIVLKDGETTGETEYFYSADNIKAIRGFSIHSNGIKIPFERLYKFHEKGLNPFALDPYISGIVLGENVSKNLVTEMSNFNGAQLEVDYTLNNSLFPSSATKISATDGKQKEVFELECF